MPPLTFPNYLQHGSKHSELRDHSGYVSADLSLMRKSCQTDSVMISCRAGDEKGRKAVREMTGDKILGATIRKHYVSETQRNNWREKRFFFFL